MELILKVTEACSFACTFCSSSNIASENTKILDIQKVYDFLLRFNVSTVIINGGDPLMVKPDYYWQIIKFLDQHDLPATLSFTTNLWAFYKKPEMWTDLFKHERVGVTTSFNYGNTRRITPTRIFTEKDFWVVSDMFLKKIGYRPDFISVITDENEDTAIDNVILAKRMNVECKLNYAMGSGDQSIPYVPAKIFKTYLEIYDHGLMRWEYNTKQLIKRLRTITTTCPLNRTCDSHIRCLQPDGDYYSCGAFGDDKKYAIDFNKEIYENKFFLPLQHTEELNRLKNECLTCSMFQQCNGCKKTIMDLKNHGLVEQHCNIMKSIAPKIIELNKI